MNCHIHCCLLPVGARGITGGTGSTTAAPNSTILQTNSTISHYRWCTPPTHTSCNTQGGHPAGYTRTFVLHDVSTYTLLYYDTHTRTYDVNNVLHYMYYTAQCTTKCTPVRCPRNCGCGRGGGGCWWAPPPQASPGPIGQSGEHHRIRLQLVPSDPVRTRQGSTMSTYVRNRDTKLGMQP